MMRKGLAMQSQMIPLRHLATISRAFCCTAYATALISSALVLTASSVHAAPAIAPSSQFFINQNDLVERVVVVRRGRAAVGPRGGAVVRRTTVVRPGVRPAVRPGWNGGGTRYVRPVRPVRPVGPWVRPSRYWWPVGGAVAAGAAIGFVTAAAVASTVGAPPAPGYCWYYTDPSQTQGFWDACPQ